MMKKFVYLFAILIASLSVTACNQQQEVVKEKPAITKPSGEKPPITKPSGEKPSSEPNGEKPSKPEKPVSDVPEEKIYQNDVFKDVIVTETEDTFIVKGKAQVFEGVFQYALYDGGKVVKESNYQTDGAPAWGEFEIIFEKELVTTNNVKFELFVYSAKDGSKVNTLEIPITNH
jgi:hypothetical protein